ncbi:MAG TPA: MotA/TolQ/ExbB proton channel family protein, partial [Spirochaetota bacterium]|nr:MotA/TolQ/ExbB proton channel family protein [Spirochaetota bacterium]
MDLASIIGLAAGTVCIILGILMAKGNLLLFWDPASVFVTLGGSLSALVLSVPLSKFLGLTKALRIVFFAPKSNANEMIITLVSFSEKARREGLLALEDDLDELEDDFLKKGIQLVVDGSDPEMVRRIMETEIEQMMDRHDV